MAHVLEWLSDHASGDECLVHFHGNYMSPDRAKAFFELNRKRALYYYEIRFVSDCTSLVKYRLSFG